jgi:hypothetical protein
MATLVGINAKFNRAHEQLSSLNREINTFIETQRHFITEEVEPETRHKIWIFRGQTPDIPIKWSVRIGEILYNFRSTLDHLIEQLVFANGQAPAERDRNAFPIFLCRKEFQDKSKPMLNGVNCGVKTLIERMQPYHGDHLLKHLWRLHMLNNIDKHRHLNMVAIPSIGGSSRIGSADPSFIALAQQGKFTPNTGSLKQNAVILRITDPKVVVNVNFAINIEFSERIPQVTDLPISNTLDVIQGAVDRVLRDLKPKLN